MSNETPTFEIRTPLGRALLAQALSAILIMGTIVLPVLILETGYMWFIVWGGLWIVAFLQMLVIRGVLQKESWGVSAALSVSIITLLLSLVAGIFWFTAIVDLLNGVYFIALAIVNLVAVVSLREVRKTT
ncbi:MAG: hypothetical protein ACFFEW_09260 [Candidatus Thorarchaeota archaeon]